MILDSGLLFWATLYSLRGISPLDPPLTRRVACTHDAGFEAARRGSSGVFLRGFSMQRVVRGGSDSAAGDKSSSLSATQITSQPHRHDRNSLVLPGHCTHTASGRQVS